MKKGFKTALFLLPFLALGLTSCGDDDSASTPTPADQLLVGKWQAQAMSADSTRMVLTFTMQNGTRNLMVEGKSTDGSTAYAVNGTYSPNGDQVDFVFPPSEPMPHKYEIDQQLLVIDKTYFYSKIGSAGDVVGGKISGRVDVGNIARALSSTDLSTNNNAVPGEALVRYRQDPEAASSSLQGLSLSSGSAGTTLTVQSSVAVGESGFMKVSYKRQSSLQAMSGETADFQKQVTERLDLSKNAVTHANEFCAELKRNNPNVESCGPNRTMILFSGLAGDNWNLPLVNQPTALTLFAVGEGDPNIKVAVLDTGVIRSHPGLQGHLIDGYDAISDPASALDSDAADTDPTDTASLQMSQLPVLFHGTHVAGIIANVAPRAKIMPVRVTGFNQDPSRPNLTSTIADTCSGLSWAVAHGAKVVNMSLGMVDVPASDPSVVALRACIQAAARAGVVLVAASGNSDRYGHTFNNATVWPCAFTEVICVGMTGQFGEFIGEENFNDYGIASNSGPRQDIVAPGYQVTSMVGPTNSYGLLSGTSQASPHVAGAAAVLLSKRNTLTSTEIRNALTSTAVDLGDPGVDQKYGAGLLNIGGALASILGRSAPLAVSYSLLHFENGIPELPLIVFDPNATVEIKDPATVPWLTIRETERRSNGLFSALLLDEAMGPGNYRAVLKVTSGASSLDVTVVVDIGDGGDPDDLEGRIRDLLAGTKDVGTIEVLLVNTQSGKVEGYTRAFAPGGYTFSFEGVAPGDFNLVAGIDLNHDGSICTQEGNEPCTTLTTDSRPGNPGDSRTSRVLSINQNSFLTNLILTLPTPTLTSTPSTR